ncbi:MAG: hypothetical protein ACREOG_03505 [Gemmatimonadaceae bacterium]
MTPDELEAELTRFVRRLLPREGVEAELRPETALFEGGYLNSLRILDLIAFLEKAQGQKIPDRDVKLANFRSIRVIAQRFGSSDGAQPNDASPERIFSHRSNRPPAGSPIETLRNQGTITIFDAGNVGLSGMPLQLLEYFDAVALEWARELGAIEHRYPSLIALESLERAGYVRSFPQHLAAVSHVEKVEDVAQRIAPESPVSSSDLGPPRYALAPAVCFHCYPEWQGGTLPAKGAIITARGRCCRFERDALAPLDRLRDFTMREIIVLGSRDDVESVRRSLMQRAEELVTALDLDASIDAATDPFYGPSADGKRLLQRAGALKYELHLRLGSDEHTVAVASFNHHADHFGRAFDIHLTSGALAHSGCVALGLERWVLAFLTQYGLDERHWPPAVTAPSAGARA